MAAGEDSQLLALYEVLQADGTRLGVVPLAVFLRRDFAEIPLRETLPRNSTSFSTETNCLQKLNVRRMSRVSGLR